MTWRDHLTTHPACDLFPLLWDTDLRALGEDIKDNGLREKIKIVRRKRPDGAHLQVLSQLPPRRTRR
jgi:hypothetical protein